MLRLKRHYQLQEIKPHRLYIIAATFPALVLASAIIVRLYQTFAAPTPPIAHWAFDEGTDNTCSGGSNDACDRTSNGNDLAKTNGTWLAEENCIAGKCLALDGSGDYLSRTDDADFDFIASDSFSITGWFRHDTIATNPDYIVGKHGATGSDGGYKVWMDSDGDIYCGIDDDDTFGPDAAANTTNANYDDGNWHYFECVKNSTTSLTLYMDGKEVNQNASIGGVGSLANSDTLYIGNHDTGTDGWAGVLDEIKLFRVNRSATDVKTDAIIGASSNGSTASIGNDSMKLLSQGLVGYWKFDHTSGNPTDSSGMSHTLTNNGTTTYVGAKFGNGSEHVPASNQYFSTATTIDGVKTVSFWVNPDSTTNYYLSLTSGAYITSNAGTLSATGFASPTMYVNGVQTTTIAANTWQLVTVTTASAINANQFYVGRQGSSYFDGTLDEVRLYARTLTASDVLALSVWAPGPTAHWKFDENGGQTITDSSGNGLNGTLGSSASVESIDPQWDIGKFGSGLLFNGGTSDRYARVDNNDLLNPGTGSMTITAWVRKDGNAAFNVQSVVIDKRNTDTNVGYALLVGAAATSCASASSDGKLVCFSISDGTNGYDMYTTNNDVLNGSGWHHIAAVFDRSSAANSKIYIDGLSQPLTTNGTFSSVGNVTNTGIACIGINQGGAACTGDNEMNGMLDDLRVYSYPRTATQIIEDMQGRSGTSSLPITIAHWKLDTIQNARTGDSALLAPLEHSLDLIGMPTVDTSSNYGDALLFNGTSQYLAGPDSEALSLTGSLTVTARIKPTAVTAATRFPIAGKWNLTTGSYLLEQYGDEIRMYIGSSSNYVTTNAANLAIHTWYHIAASYSASSQSVTIFVNGKPQATTTTGSIPSSISDSSNGFSIGSDNGGVSYFVTTNGDDGNEINNATWTSSPGVGSLAVGYYSGAYNDVHIGVRYQSIAIAQGTTINAARLSIKTSDDFVGSNISSRIYADDVDSAVAWSSTSRPSQITLTAAYTDWTIRENVVERWFDSPSIASVVGEIVARAGWASGNTMRFAVKNQGTTGQNLAALYDYNYGPRRATRFFVNANDASAKYYAGSIDEVRIYQSALTASEVGYDINENASVTVGAKNQHETTNQALIDNGNPAVSYWKFDEGSGSSATDTGANANTLTLQSSASFTSGTKGNALSLNGSSDYASRANPTSLPTGSTSRTIEAWVFRSASQPGGAVLHYGNDATAGQESILLLSYISGSYYLFADGVNAGNSITLTSQQMPTENEWNHVALVINSSTTYKYYLNGVLTKSGSFGVAINTIASPTIVNVGTRSDTSQGYWSGKIDDLRVYDYARTFSQISYDYRNTDPLLWWKLDEGTGTSTVSDSSGNEFTGTMNGSMTSGDWVEGANGSAYALDMDGSNDYISSSVDGTSLNELTISFWANSAATVSGLRGIFSWSTLPTSGNPFINIAKKSANTTLQVFIDDDYKIISSLALANGTWNHIALTLNSDNVWRFYINGVEDGAYEDDGTHLNQANASTVYFGSGPTATYNGIVDDLRIYPYAISKETIQQMINTKKPLAWWKFDENQGGSTYDSSGNELTGSITSGSWDPGRHGSSLRFDGSNTVVSMGASPTIQFVSQSFSWSAQIKTTSTADSFIAGRWNGQGYTNTLAWYMSANYWSDNKASCTFYNNLASVYTVTSTTSVNDGRWHHILCNHDTGKNEIEIYVDGVREDVTAAALSNVGATNAFTVGKGSVSAWPFTGWIDDVRVFDYSQSQEQASMLYNEGKPFAQWKFDECSGTTANSSGGYSTNFTGTITPGASGNTAATSCTSGSSVDMWNNGSSGKFSGSLDFDGTDDYVTVSDNATLRFDNAYANFSVFAWIKRNANGEMNIISKEDADNDGWRLQVNSSNQVVCSVDAIDISSSATITDTSWHHVGCTIHRDGSGQVYIDGKQDGEIVGIGQEAMANTSALAIGTRSYSSTNYFNGLIDEVSVFSYALSPSQVRNLANNRASLRFGQ